MRTGKCTSVEISNQFHENRCFRFLVIAVVRPSRARKIAARQTATIHATLQEDMAAMATASGVARKCTPVSCRTTNNPRPGTTATALQW
jgi:hypothetical protein